MSDLISRQALLNKFEPWLKVKDYSDGELNMLKAILYEIRFMSATDTNVGNKLGTNLAEVGTDCISRQAAIDALLEAYPDNMDVEFILGKLPPAQPKRGKWIDAVIPNDNGGLLVQVCDQCNTFFPLAYTGGGHHFCPNCGAEMRGEQNE